MLPSVKNWLRVKLRVYLLVFSKNFIFSKKLIPWDTRENLFSRLKLIFLLSLNPKLFSWHARKYLEIGKNQKKNYIAADGFTENFHDLLSFYNDGVFFFFFWATTKIFSPQVSPRWGDSKKVVLTWHLISWFLTFGPIFTLKTPKYRKK